MSSLSQPNELQSTSITNLHSWTSPTMGRKLPVTRTALSAPEIGFMTMTLLVCAFALFMCASHSRRRRRQWNECYGFFDEEPISVIEILNDTAIVGMHQPAMSEEEGEGEGKGKGGEEGEESVFQGEDVSVWQKNILMGGKCQLPDFSGVIIYDADGNLVAPHKTPRLTWK